MCFFVSFIGPFVIVMHRLLSASELWLWNQTVGQLLDSEDLFLCVFFGMAAEINDQLMN